jgi:hypothetical protein
LKVRYDDGSKTTERCLADGCWDRHERAKELHSAVSAGEWSGFPEELHNIPIVTWNFLRGFVHSVALPCAEFMRHAAELFREPVEKVTLSGKVPYRTYSDARYWWSERPRTNIELIHPNDGLIPMELLKLIPSYRRDSCVFVTEADALAGLSAACVAFGRAAHAKKYERVTA